MATTYTPKVPLGSLITFDQKQCTHDKCVMIGNASYCMASEIDNYLFQDDWSNEWTVTSGTKNGENPATIENDITTKIATITQDIDIDGGDYTIFYSFEVGSASGAVWNTVTFLIDVDSVTAVTAGTDHVQRGSIDLSTSASGVETFQAVITLDRQTDITLNYIFICPNTGWTPDSDWCFQLPMFSTGSELLGLTNNLIDYDAEFDVSTNHNPTQNTTTNLCGTPYEYCGNVDPTPDNTYTITKDSKYFWHITTGDISITYGQNADDNTVGELQFEVYDSGGGCVSSHDTINFTELDKNTDIISLGTKDWVAGDSPVQLYINAKSECDDTDEHIQFDVNITNFQGIPNTYTTTFTATDDTFYRLSYKLNKASISQVKVYDSASVLLYNASSDGVLFNKIFKTGGLPVDKTVTVEFIINDLITFPNTDFNKSVITEVELYEMCNWTTWVETDQEVFVKSFTETHDTTNESTGVTYHPNLEYCLDSYILESGCYQVRAIDNCDSSRFKISNCFTICDTNCDLSQIAWTPAEVICSGDEVIDYETYPSTTYFWSKADLQDMNIERSREIYRRSDGYWETPYTYQNQVEVLQIWHMPPFVRHALSIGLSGTFKIDGVEYQTLNEDDISPVLNVVYDSPIRIPVTKVGAFTTRRL